MTVNPSYGDPAPIAAIATPLGESALAVIRVSGPDTVERIARIFSRPEALRNAPGNTAVHGWIIKPGINGAVTSKGEPKTKDGARAETKDAAFRVDEVMVTVYRAPRSYTGEESADISCHGGVAPARGVMRVLHAAGFRDSLPGEFTFRAFINGKLDLTRAEAVMELVSSKTERGREHAVRRLSGVLETEIRRVKDLLVHALAGMELLLDYSEDEADPAGAPEDIPLVEETLTRLRALAASYHRERLYQDGALVVIAGRPNAGKSSLFNLLLKEDRSIVTPIPGTTRDWLESWIAIEGIPIRLVDTAGLQDTEDPVERLGVERSRELLAGADLALYLIDGSMGLSAEDRAFFRDQAVDRGEGNPAIPVLNKVDIAPDLRPDAFFIPGAIGISAKTGEGIPALTRAIAAELEAAWPSAFAGGNGREDAGGVTPGIATARQSDLISAAIDAVEEALALEAHGQPLDLAAPLLREAVNALGEITGEVSTTEILETMFSRFCVGK
jgi:tRNA modification GTPase